MMPSSDARASRSASCAEGLAERFDTVRSATEALTQPLSAEDAQVQSMADVSPTKWHLAHTSWFFETFILVPHLFDYRAFDANYSVLFNSYYVGVGARYPRAQRGLISRPSLDEVMEYRHHVDEAMARFLSMPQEQALLALVELGLNHEQQHQELILTDIQHVLSCNPIEPAYRSADPVTPPATPLLQVAVPGGLYAIGHDGEGFAFDNERPRHRSWLEPFAIASRLVTASEYADFIADNGYGRPELWLSDGWAMVETQGWSAPLYWREEDGTWTCFSLNGRRRLVPEGSVRHVSYYEADAYARWAGARLPTEAEWEVAASQSAIDALYDQAWQWTASPYVAYPGFAPAEGAVGEYNGKFMINQMVLRGGSVATPPGHSRASYRNFFPPDARWQFSGIRLAWDAPGGAKADR